MNKDATVETNLQSVQLNNIMAMLPRCYISNIPHIDALKGNEVYGLLDKGDHPLVTVCWDKSVIPWLLGDHEKDEHPLFVSGLKEDEDTGMCSLVHTSFDPSLLDEVLPIDRSTIVLDHLDRLKKEIDTVNEDDGLYVITFPPNHLIDDQLSVMFIHDRKTDESLAVLNQSLIDHLENVLVTWYLQQDDVGVSND